MRTLFSFSRWYVLFAGCFALSACGGASSGVPLGSSAVPASTSTTLPNDLKSQIAQGYVKPVCGLPISGQMTCTAYAVTSGGAGLLGKRRKLSPLDHYGPADLQAAYGINSSAGAGRVVAVVEAGSYPTLESDLSTYRSFYNLPSCTTASGCLRVVNQSGGTALPPRDDDWAIETALDIDMISALCPQCHILVVEANSRTFGDIAAAENTAANLGAFAVSNSFGAPESTHIDSSAFNHPGVAIFASAGDGGYFTGSHMPAAFSTVIAVGGTTLTRDASSPRGWRETVWSGSEGACSGIVSKPAWQNDTGCHGRTIADVALDADPSTGVTTYDAGGWDRLSGTSVAAPAVAAIYALAGLRARYRPISLYLCREINRYHLGFDRQLPARVGTIL